MAGSGAQPDKDRIIDAIVLVVTRPSSLRGLIAPDVLRDALSVEFEDMLNPAGELDLQPVWEILETQPSFNADTVTAAMCRLKTFESRLAIEVKLPTALAGLKHGEVSMKASEIRLPPGLTNEIGPAAPAARPKRTTSQQRPTAAPPPAGSEGRRSRLPGWVLPLALVAALGGFGYTGFTLYQGCSTPRADWKSVDLDALSALPVKGARRFGTQVDATLSDEAWLSKGEAARKADLQAALDKLGADGVRVLVLRDARGNIRATVQRSPKTNQISFRFLAAP